MALRRFLEAELGHCSKTVVKHDIRSSQRGSEVIAQNRGLQSLQVSQSVVRSWQLKAMLDRAQVCKPYSSDVRLEQPKAMPERAEVYKPYSTVSCSIMTAESDA